MYLHRAVGIVYLHGYAKMEINMNEKKICTEEVPVQMGHRIDTVLRFMNPITEVFYQNYTFTECNALYPN